jgi:hypothetical protein
MNRPMVLNVSHERWLLGSSPDYRAGPLVPGPPSSFSWPRQHIRQVCVLDHYGMKNVLHNSNTTVITGVNLPS